MELNVIQKLISMLPAGEKRDALVRKMNAVARSKESKGGGLHDEFSFQPKGHIMIEEIDANGQVLGVLADQPNLVVKGSEEILLRAFSGDPKRTLYKNRVIKEYKNSGGVLVNNVTKPYNVELDQITMVLNGEDIVPHHQNEIWKAVDDSDFDIEYSYYPNMLYVKAEPVPLEPGMTTFKLYNKANAPVGSAPLQAEVYSNYSNLFIGLGDGVNKRISFSDERFELTGFTEEGDTLVSPFSGSKVKFSAKISNLHVIAEGEGALKITAGGVDKGTFSLTDLEGETKIEVTNLNSDATTDVVIEMVTGANVVIKEIAFDEFSVMDNALMREFENYTLRFDTPTSYNANTDRTSFGTFTLQLNNAPVVKESVKLTYDSNPLEAVEAIEQVKAGKYFLDADTGVVHLAEPLTGVLAAYSVTGELHEDEPRTALKTTTTAIVRKTIETTPDVTLTSQLDGVKTDFVMSYKRIQAPEEVVVEQDGVALSYGADYTLDAETATLTLIPKIIPAKEAVLAEDGVTIITPAEPEKKVLLNKTTNTLVVRAYKYEKHTSETLETYEMTLKNTVRAADIRIKDHREQSLVLVENQADLLEGKFLLKQDVSGKARVLVIGRKNAQKEIIQKVEVFYHSEEKPGELTNYTRQVVEKPKTKNEYPWFQLDKGKIVFVAEFAEKTPNHNVTIREMGLFDGPRADDKIRGFNNYNVKAFSLVRVGETRKEATTGLRVTWTITLLNEENVPFKGGL